MHRACTHAFYLSAFRSYERWMNLLICLQIVFGEVQTSAKAVVERLGVQTDVKPSLVLICNGDLQLREQYEV